MKLRIRYKTTTKVLCIDGELDEHVTLHNVSAAARELFTNNLPSNFCLSLNKRDLLEGDDKPIKDFGVISGDLVHVIDLDHNPEDESLPASQQIDQSGSSTKSHDDPRVDNPAAQAECSNNLQLQVTDSKERKEQGKKSCDQEMTNDQPVREMEDEPPFDHAVVNRYLNEPMFCQDSTENKVPSILQHLFSTSDINNSHDALCVLLHVMMLESGYKNIQQCDDSEGEKSLITMADDWRCRTPACTKLKYTHSSCSDIEATFTLTCVPMSSVMVVHGTVSGQNKVQSVQSQLKITDFVKEISENAAKCYKNQTRLSRIFKDNIALPLIQSFQEANGMVPVQGIMALSYEIKLKILGDLDIVSVLRCSEVCKEFHNLSRDRCIWRRLFLKDFGNRLHSDMSLTKDWFELYKKEYKQRKERRKMLSQMTMIVPPGFLPPTHRPIPIPHAPYHPGILGGDYDLNPQFPGIPGPSFGPNRPLMRPRFDPVGPLPEHNIFPNRRGPRGPFGGFGGPRLF